MSQPGSPRPTVGIPILGDVPAWGLEWGLVAILAIWITLTVPVSAVLGVPGHLGLLVVMAALAAGTIIGARTTPARAAMTMAVSGLAFAAGLGLVILASDHLPEVASHLITAGSSSRLGVAAGLAGLIGFLIAFRRRTMIRPAELVMAAAVLLFLVVDRGILASQLMRDLRLDLGAGATFLHGGSPYITTLFTSIPADHADLPYLYPPFTLPFFAILSMLPELPVLIAWLALSIGASILGLRTIGVRWLWISVLLLWPPFFEGLAVGNVAVLTFAVFACAPRLPAVLPAMAIFKLQSAIPGLWLARDGRWRSLLTGLVTVGAILVLTLPLVGLTSWSAWFDSLLLFQQSQHLLHSLYAFALPGYIPYVAYVILAVSVSVVALVLGRGPDGLARLGIASIVASPSLYRHGFLVSLPGLLGNDELLFWAALAAAGNEAGWWVLALIGFVGTFRFARTDRPPQTVHPLGHHRSPWPEAASA
jgi:hypothetical protein